MFSSSFFRESSYFFESPPLLSFKIPLLISFKSPPLLCFESLPLLSFKSPPILAFKGPPLLDVERLPLLDVESPSHFYLLRVLPRLLSFESSLLLSFRDSSSSYFRGSSSSYFREFSFPFSLVRPLGYLLITSRGFLPCRLVPSGASPFLLMRPKPLHSRQGCLIVPVSCPPPPW